MHHPIKEPRCNPVAIIIPRERVNDNLPRPQLLKALLHTLPHALIDLEVYLGLAALLESSDEALDLVLASDTSAQVGDFEVGEHGFAGRPELDEAEADLFLGKGCVRK